MYRNEAYYLSKTPIYKTDYENSANGYLYVGTKIDDGTIEDLRKGFLSIKFISNPEITLQENKSNHTEAITLRNENII